MVAGIPVMKRLAVALGGFFAALADELPAQTVTPEPPSAVSWDVGALELMNQRRFDDALALIESRLTVRPGDTDALFFKGLINVAKGEYRGAISSFRAILIDHPGSVRVRLELARAFYLNRDFGNASRQFRLALGGDLPAPVVANIRAYLGAIREAKDVSYSASLSVAPDSNINTGSSAREVSLFGLPFDLSDDARKRSGVGIAVDSAGEWAPRIGAHARLRTGVGLQRREYRRSGFDDMTLALYAGPRRAWNRTDVSLLGSATWRWYGGRPYYRGLGMRLEASHDATPRLSVSGAASLTRIRYRQSPEMDGTISSLAGGVAYALTPASALTLRGGLSRQGARDEGYANWAEFVGIGYHRELPLGFTVSVEPSLSSARYDAPLLAFGERRKDRTRSLGVTLLNRRILLSRFTPRLLLTSVRQSSSIPLYAFKKNRVEMGLTTVF